MKRQEEKRKKEKVMIRLYAYTSEKKKVKTKKKIKKDISKYLAKVNSEKSRFITPDDLALLAERRKEFKSKDFVLPYMCKREFKELLKEDDKRDGSLFRKFYIIEEPVTILHLGSLLENLEINSSNIKLYLDGKKVELIKRKLSIASCKMAKHRLPFKKKEIKIIKTSLTK